jgi:hypothetical protein
MSKNLAYCHHSVNVISFSQRDYIKRVPMYNKVTLRLRMESFNLTFPPLPMALSRKLRFRWRWPSPGPCHHDRLTEFRHWRIRPTDTSGRGPLMKTDVCSSAKKYEIFIKICYLIIGITKNKEKCLADVHHT